MVEHWLPFVDYEGLYEVSDRGQVRSLDRVVTQVNRWGNLATFQHRGRVMKQALTKNGYLYVGVSQDGKRQPFLIHRCVLCAFVGPCPEGQESLHGPGGKLDNRWPENLRWGTREENMADKYRDGTMSVGRRSGMAKLDDESAPEMRRRYLTGGITQQALADEYGVGQSTVARVVAGTVWRHVL